MKSSIRRFIGFTLISVFLFIVSANGQAAKQVRILFLLDGSSSMTYDWQENGAGSEERFARAREIVGRIMDSVYRLNPRAEFGLRVFGHQYATVEKNCFDSRLEVPFSLEDRQQILQRMKYITPRGYSPIAWSLEQAALYDFSDAAHYVYSIIMITDGGESCGGDICGTVQRLLGEKISFRPYILSLVDYKGLEKEYDCLGTLLNVTNENQEKAVISKIINDNRPVLERGGAGLTEMARYDYHTPSSADTSRHSMVMAKEPATVPVPSPAKEKAGVVNIQPETALRNQVPAENKAKTEGKDSIVDNAPAYHYTPLTDGKIKMDPMGHLNMLMVYDYRPIMPRRVVYHAMQFPESPAVAVKPNNPPASGSNGSNTRPKAAPGGSAGNAHRQSSAKSSNSTSVAKAEQPVKAVAQPPVYDTIVEVKIVATPAKETSVNIYFVDADGRPVQVETAIKFASSRTGKEKLQTYMSYDEAGKPRPIKIPAGSYIISRVGKPFQSKQVTLQEDAQNDVYIPITNGTLGFYYTTNRKKPISDVVALVSKRFKQSNVTKQNGDEILPYAPGWYHIEFNTLPPKDRFTYLSFNETEMIGIPENGTLRIDNENSVGKVVLFYPDGDMFKQFYQMDVNGSAAGQQLDLLPGAYRARYMDPATRRPKEVAFMIKSNQVTPLHLN